MCGITGKFNFDPRDAVSRDEVVAMLAPISHRGPDGHGVFLDHNVGLGHCRLAIIDVDGGPQPMTNEDKSVWIVFNGEIYNYLHLREELLAAGHQFRSKSDTEVIIHLYEEYGYQFLDRLDGMFAFAIWDRRNERLIIARDRVGIKPLYYSRTTAALLFSSEQKAILSNAATERQVDHTALRQFYEFSYVPGERTLFSSVRRLLPGHFLVVTTAGVTTQKYWDLKFSEARKNTSFEDAVEQLYSLLSSTVRSHMIADVPVGVLLSGGVDSSAVLNFAVQATDKKIKTFTVGFDGAEVVDERPYAHLAAQRFGTEHFDMSITAEDFWQFLPRFVYHMENPVCEPPAVALYYISKLARDHVKVLLSGEGGDEAFAGYPNYPHNLRLHQIATALGPFARPLGTIGEVVGHLCSSERLLRYAGALGRPLHEYYFSRSSGPSTFFNRNFETLFTPDFLIESKGETPAAYMEKLLDHTRDWEPLDRMLYADTKSWLPDDLLIKADKITMANSLELRVPLLDHKVLEFAATLGHDHKVRGYETKRVLKAAFTRVLPREILTRKKVGFPVPYSQWLRVQLAPRTRDLLLSTRAKARNIFRPEQVEKTLSLHQKTGGYAKAVFSMLVTELWFQQFVDAK